MKLKMTKKAWQAIGKKTGWEKFAFGNIEWIELGPNPSGEDCAQVGSDDYSKLTRMETRAYIEQLKRQFPNVPMGAAFGVKAFPHDFGTYHEVVIKYQMDNEEAEQFAYDVESSLPEYWDDQAKAELQQLGYFDRLQKSKREKQGAL